MAISIDTIKDGLKGNGWTFLAPESHPEICIVAFDGGSFVTLRFVCNGKVLFINTNALADLSSLTESQQAFFHSRICLWNFSLALGRVSVEPNGCVILQNTIPVDAVSVLSPELMVSVIANLVIVWHEISAEMRVMLLAVLVDEKEQQKPRPNAPQNHRFGHFFSDN